MKFHEFSILILLIWIEEFAIAQTTQYAVVGSTVQIRCPYNGRNNNFISWFTRGAQITFETTIYNNVPDLTARLSITGNHAAGEYHLSISDVKKTDEGRYDCKQTTPATTSEQRLVVIVGPTSVNISNKTSEKLQGTEDQDLTISCTAVGGDPAPDLTLQIGTDVHKVDSQHTLLHTILKTSRSYDGVTVTCLTGYDGITYTPLTDTAGITLYLKPLTPTFSMTPIVTQNTQSLVLLCTSTGSRPAPTEWNWLIDNVNITPSSKLSSPTPQANGTFSITSTLTYKFSKEYNKKNITCGFKNIATGNAHVSAMDTIDVQYSPEVTVQYKNFTPTQTSREIQCAVDSNPDSTYSRWQHKSKYGDLIRELDGGVTLVLPPQTEENRYQDTGEYVCTVSNGIRDEDGNMDQRGSGYVISTAPPRFLNGSSQVKLGQFGKDVTIDVSVYSVPKYDTPTWLKNGTALLRSGKYTTEEVSDVITDTFYDTKVKVDGYRLTLSIKNLVESDFVNFTVKLNNSVGQTVQHIIELISASSPEMPGNFSVSDETESTVILHWLPGFDGGHKQWFGVQYRSVGSQMWQETKIRDQIQFTDNELHSYTLSGLQDGTSYEIRVYAENKFNKSLPTNIEKISTKVAESSSIGPIIGGVVGVLVVVVAALSIVAFIILKKRREGKGAKMIPRSEDESDDEGLKDNIIYNCEPRKNPPETSTSMYAEVQKPNAEYAEVQKPNAVYADVQKPDKQKANKPKKEKKAKGKKNNIKGMNNNAPEKRYDIDTMEQTEYANAAGPSGTYKNADGLQYADISFSNQVRSIGGKPVIHGEEDRTIYSEVDHTKKAPPPPQEGAYELTDIGKGK